MFGNCPAIMAKTPYGRHLTSVDLENEEREIEDLADTERTAGGYKDCGIRE